MTNKKQRFCAFFLIVVLMLSIGSVALATATKPYARYGCHFHDDRDDYGTAYTDRCSCSPVNNYLAAKVKIQYRDGDQYKTTRWSSWAKGTNVETKYVRKSEGLGTYCNYIQGMHEARCGSGSKVAMNSEKSR